MKPAADRQLPIPIGTALLASFRQGYTLRKFRGDLLAGLTVGIIAVPLSMALAIAVGAPPQHGLYTAIVAGALIPLAGGSRFSISGPTAAFVVILLPITGQYGLGGLMVTTIMAGLILLGMGIARLGRLIQFIPYPVTVGFTAGIAVVIATLQFKDFLGLTVSAMPEHYVGKVMTLVAALPTVNPPDLAIGAITLLCMLLWPRLRTPVPPHLAALLFGALAAWLGTRYLSGFEISTIGSRFNWTVGAETGHGIPPFPPMPVLPWLLPDASGQAVGLGWDVIRSLIGPAFTVAMLAAIESLLCAVIADGLTRSKHDPNAELIGQGIGNLVVPFFGGITATAAISRTAVNIRAGANSPLAAVTGAGVVLLAVVVLAPLMAYIPMATLAALLLMVAWNVAEAKHFLHITRVAPRSDVAVLLTCFGLTVFFDMVLAVGVGVVLASLLFIRRMTEMTGSAELRHEEHELRDLPPHIAVYAIEGPMFFGAAEQAINTLHEIRDEVKAIIIDMSEVPMIDMSGIVALDSMIQRMNEAGVAIVVSGLSGRIYHKMLRAGLRKRPGQLAYATTLVKARTLALRMRPNGRISLAGMPD
jgi:sulfate permease, SulP family